MDSGIHPRVPTFEQQRRHTRMSPTTAPTLPHRILLVDDDVDGRDAIAHFLEMEGADVAVAADGKEALNALRADPRRCLILLDLEMPGMDGREFRRQQRL